MIRPTITRELLWEILDYDKDTGVLTWKKRKIESPHWRERDAKAFNTCHAGKEAGKLFRYGQTKALRRQVKLFNKNYFAYRLIWVMMTGDWPEQGIDHIDQDSTNDRWENLREASNSVNQRNSRMKKNNTSGYTGIRWVEKENRWRQETQCNGVRYRSSHKTKEEAVAERERLKKEHGFTENHGRPRIE